MGEFSSLASQKAGILFRILAPVHLRDPILPAFQLKPRILGLKKGLFALLAHRLFVAVGIGLSSVGWILKAFVVTVAQAVLAGVYHSFAQDVLTIQNPLPFSLRMKDE